MRRSLTHYFPVQFRSKVAWCLSLVTSTSLVSKGFRNLVSAGLVPKFVWTRFPVAMEFTVPLPNGRKFNYRSSYGDQIGWWLYLKGLEYWEAETLPVFCNWAEKSKIILDIGANTGVYSLVASAINPKCQVTAFEPVPVVYKKLAGNIELNSFEDRCQAHRGSRVQSRRILQDSSSLRGLSYCVCDVSPYFDKRYSLRSRSCGDNRGLGSS